MRTAARLAILAAAAIPVAGCASAVQAHAPGPPPPTSVIGDIPQGQPYVTVATADGSAAVSVPQGWQRTAGGASLLFTSGFDSVAIDTATVSRAPTVSSVTAEAVPELQATHEGFLLGDVSAVSEPAGPAILATYQAQSVSAARAGPIITLAMERYEFWRAGHDLVLTLSSPAGTENGAAWRQVTDSVRWLP